MKKNTTDNRLLDLVEQEFAYALETHDKAAIIDILKERSDIAVFFCAVAIIKKGSSALRSVADELPDEIKHLAPLIKRMAKDNQKGGFTSLEKIEKPQVMKETEGTENE